MMTDKQRCEVSFISRLIHLITIKGIKCDDKAHHEELAEKAYQAAVEPFNDCDDKRRVALKRRVGRMELITIAPMEDHINGEKAILIIYLFVERLINANYLIIPEESKFRELIDYMLSLVDTGSDIFQKRFKSSQKQAVKWLESLQREGYYQL